VKQRIVFDTNTVISALLFANGRLAWLRAHWRDGGCVPLVSRTTVAELSRVLAYPKFRLSQDDRLELLGDYLPYCETIEAIGHCALICRDANDQQFMDLAQSGAADVLMSGDEELLAFAGRTAYFIETPEAYRPKVAGAENDL
jgi:uncharacterized protein